jgi:4-hydroxythreonine-4-phosphate dehydrogenase
MGFTIVKMKIPSNQSGVRPIIGVTMGDPLGIGPEIIIKAMEDQTLRDRADFRIYGSNAVFIETADRLGLPVRWQRVSCDSPRRQRPLADRIVVIDDPCNDDDVLARGAHPSRRGGMVSKAAVEAAIIDARRPREDAEAIDAVVTAPICKQSWNLAGFKWPGHTELFASRCHVKRSAMMFASPTLRVVLATAHIPLLTIRDQLTIGRVFDPIELGYHACQELGIEHPRIAVCGLNPHAGEGGIIGDEDGRIIRPAIDMAIEHSINASGPWPADTVFRAAIEGKYDLVVAMYHDQGLIPIKLTCPGTAVNWTIGLPIIRTSPDHGTAFDIAGTGKASPESMIAAIEFAIDLARRRVSACATS